MKLNILQITLLSIILVFEVACQSDKGQIKTSDHSPIQVELTNESSRGLSKRELMELALPGKLAPEGLLRDVSNKEVDLKDFRGKLLVIDFWATYCAPCLKELPKFIEMSKNYDEEQVEFITISTDDPYDYWKDYVVENNWTNNSYWMGLENENLIRSFVHSEIEVENELLILEALPKYVIISKEGEILLNSNQKPSTEAFKEKLETYLQL